MASLPQESSNVGSAPDVVDIPDLEVEAAANAGASTSSSVLDVEGLANVESSISLDLGQMTHTTPEIGVGRITAPVASGVSQGHVN